MQGIPQYSTQISIMELSPMPVDIKRINEIKGFLEPEEGLRLYETALEAGRLGPCLEIGSYCGKSTVYIGTACRENRQILFTIDHHRGSEEQQPGEEYFDPDLLDERTGLIDTFLLFRQNIGSAGLEDTVVPMVCRSEVAAKSWKTPLAMVFIDGGHAYETVYTDYTGWSGFIIKAGYLLFHDIYRNPEDGGQAPYEVYQAALKTGLYKELPMTGSLGVLKKK